MGPPSENGGYGRAGHDQRQPLRASMGPPSENGGYGLSPSRGRCGRIKLQWVHRPRTVVVNKCLIAEWPKDLLQWVHRPRTVVMADCGLRAPLSRVCFNGSTVRERWLCPL